MKKFISHLSLGLALGAGAMTVPVILTRPAIAQQIVDAAPSGDEILANSSITWKFDNASLVDANSLKLMVDGVDVTAQSIMDTRSNTFGYKPSTPFKVGTHNVELQFKNTRGIVYKATWAFDVANIQLDITAVYHNANQGSLATGDEFRTEIRGTPKANAQIFLIQNGNTVRSLTPTETASGVYKASFPITSRDQVNEGIVIARLEKSGKVIFRTVDSPFAINSVSTPVATSGVTQTVVTQPTNTSVLPTNPNQALTVEVTSPRNNEQMNAAAGFTLTGKTLPGATVTITAQVEPLPPSLLQTLGSLVTGSSATGRATSLFNREPVTVKEDGTFEVVVPRTAGVSAGQVYRMTVQAQRGTEMKTVSLSVKQQ